MHINVSSLLANFDKLQSLLADMKLKPYIISINETWLITTKMVNSTTYNYVFISNNRIHSKSGE